MKWCCPRGASPISSGTRSPSGNRRSPRTSGCRAPVSSMSRLISCAFGAALALFSAPAFALTLEVTHAGPSVVGEAHAFKASVAEATGMVSLQWKFSESEDFVAGGLEASHVFTAPGHYSIDVLATDANGDVAS